MSQNGKGSRTRPKTVDQKTWDKNWNRIFGSKANNKSHKKDKKINLFKTHEYS